MDPEAFERAVAAVDWSALRGAYGPSDGSTEYGASDVAVALQVLARETEVDGDAWRDAVEVLLGHVWHQGTVYPVTPAAWPFVLRLADELPAGRRGELAQVVARFVLGALECDGEAEDQPTAHAIFELSRRDAHVILGWVDDERGEAAAAIVRAVPDLLPRWIEAIEAVVLGAAEWLVLATLPQLPPWVRERALVALFDTNDATATAAAILVSREEPPTRAVAERLDEVLRPGAEARLRSAFDLPLPIPELPRGPFAGFGGEIHQAKALFVGGTVVTLRIGAARNLTLRWVPDGLCKGATVHIGMTTSGRPCWIEWTTASGRRERVGLTAELTRGP